MDWWVRITLLVLCITFPDLASTQDCHNGLIDLALLVDVSGSVPEEDFVKIRAFIDQLISRLDVDSGQTRVGLVRFSNNDIEDFSFDSYATSAQMKTAVSTLSSDYESTKSNTDALLEYATNVMFNSARGDRPYVQNIIALFTDGGSSDKEATFSAAQKARESSHILAVGLGNWVDKYELQAIVSDQYLHNIVYAEDLEQLDTYLDPLANKLCNVVNECQSSPCLNGGVCIDSIDMYYCQCRFNYAGIHCEYECSVPSDVAIILDTSASIGSANFQKVVNFTKYLSLNLPNTGEGAISLMTYSDDTELYMDFHNRAGVIGLMDAMTIPYFKGIQTSTTKALITARTQLFTEISGYDPDTPNIIIIVTDGHSDNSIKAWHQSYVNRLNAIHTIAIGLPSNIGIDESSLQAMASWPSDSNMWSVQDFGNLNDIVPQVRSAVCNEKFECSSMPCLNGGTCVDGIQTFFCYCGDSYTGRFCERECSGFADVAFILDVSGSTLQEHFGALQELVVSVMENLEIWNGRVRVALVTFSDTARVQFFFNSFRTLDDNLEAVRRTLYEGGRTNISGAFKVAREEVFGDITNRKGIRDFTIIFTDGQANVDQSLTMNEAILLKTSGVRIITMSVGTHINIPVLNAIASEPVEDNVMIAPSYQTLNVMTAGVVAAMCNDVNDCEGVNCGSGTCTDGFGSYVCSCSGSATGRHCDRRCARRMDITFALDVSGSIDEGWKYGMTFFKNVILGLNMGRDSVRTSLVVFSDEAEVRYYLDTFNDPSDMLLASSVVKIRGATNTQAALSTIREYVLKSNRGDRADAINVVIVVTDGASNVLPDRTVPEAELLKATGASVFVVASGINVNNEEIIAMATDNSDKFILRVQDEIEVNEQSERLLTLLCG